MMMMMMMNIRAEWVRSVKYFTECKSLKSGFIYKIGINHMTGLRKQRPALTSHQLTWFPSTAVAQAVDTSLGPNHTDAILDGRPRMNT